MSPFGNDPFDEIIREFFGQAPSARRRHREQFIEGEDDDRIIDFIEDNKKIYLVFELPGYEEKDVSVNVEGRNLKVEAKKTNGENIQDYLNQKLKRGVVLQKTIPDFVDSKKFSQTMKNGVLEIVFDKGRKK